MNSIGIVEANVRLAQIFERVHETREPILITKQGVPFVRIDPIFSETPSSVVWAQRRAFIERYGEISPDFESPPRITLTTNMRLFDE